MASFLVSPQIDVFAISTMEQAIDLDAKVCVQNGGVLTSILEDRYGAENLTLVPKDTEADIFLGLKDGSCLVAAHQMNTYRIYEKNIDVNHDCTLSSELRVVQPVPAGMATAIGTSENEYCSSLISHVLDYHLTTMIAEGFVERAMKYHLSKISTVECISEPPRAGDFSGSTFSLTLQDLGGIFILHLICVMVALMAGIFQFYRYNTTDKPIAEVFFVKQAGKEIHRRRDSIRMSIRNSAAGGGGEDALRSSFQTQEDSTLFSATGSGNGAASSKRRKSFLKNNKLVIPTVAEEELSSSLSVEDDYDGVRSSGKSSNCGLALLEILEEDSEDDSTVSGMNDTHIVEARAAEPTVVSSLGAMMPMEDEVPPMVDRLEDTPERDETATGALPAFDDASTDEEVDTTSPVKNQTELSTKKEEEMEPPKQDPMDEVDTASPSRNDELNVPTNNTPLEPIDRDDMV